MNLESQCVSLELAKQLKEAGVPQSSLFYWRQLYFKQSKTGEPFIEFHQGQEAVNYTAENICSAFTVAELGEMLKGFELPYFNFGTGWQVKQIKDYHRPNNEAEARGLLLKFLIQSNLINPSNLK